MIKKRLHRKKENHKKKTSLRIEPFPGIGPALLQDRGSPSRGLDGSRSMTGPGYSSPAFTSDSSSLILSICLSSGQSPYRPRVERGHRDLRPIPGSYLHSGSRPRTMLGGTDCR